MVRNCYYSGFLSEAHLLPEEVRGGTHRISGGRGWDLVLSCVQEWVRPEKTELIGSLSKDVVGLDGLLFLLCQSRDGPDKVETTLPVSVRQNRCSCMNESRTFPSLTRGTVETMGSPSETLRIWIPSVETQSSTLRGLCRTGRPPVATLEGKIPSNYAPTLNNWVIFLLRNSRNFYFSKVSSSTLGSRRTLSWTQEDTTVRRPVSTRRGSLSVHERSGACAGYRWTVIRAVYGSFGRGRTSHFPSCESPFFFSGYEW